MKIIEIWKPLRTIAFALILSLVATSAVAGIDDDFNIEVDTKSGTATVNTGADFQAGKDFADEELGRNGHPELQFHYDNPDLQNAMNLRANESGYTSSDNSKDVYEIMGINNTCSMSIIKKEYLDKSSTNYCWYCNITSTMTNAYLSAVAECTGVVQTLALLILRYGFLIWLAYYILQQVSSLAPTSPGKMLQEILMMGFQVLLATLAVRQGIPLLTEYFLDPVMLMGIDYGQEMLDGITTADVGSYTSEASRANGAGGAASIGGGGGGFSGGGIGGGVR